MRKLFLYVILHITVVAIGQPFIQDIYKFQKQDSISMPPSDAILFVGSSSFTNWVDVQAYFPEHTIINRGFGGSSLTDLIRYFDKIIMPYKPKHIVIYCGENDLADNEKVTGDMVFERFRTLYLMILSTMPKVQISYVSMKPSPSRWHLKNKQDIGNEKIKYLCDNTENMTFIDIRPAMLDENGLPDETIFLEDKLHMNAAGYKRWQSVIGPFLKL